MNVKLIRLVDRHAGNFLLLILGIFVRTQPLGKPKNILLIQLWGIGESILTLPAINALRKSYKGRISVLCTSRNKDVYFKNPDLDLVISIKPGFFSILKAMIKNFRSYDLVIDMEEYLNTSALLSFSIGKKRLGYSHGIRSRVCHQTVPYNDRQHVSQTFMDLLKPLRIRKKASKLPRLICSKTDENHAMNILKNFGISGKFAVFSPGSAESSKIRLWKNSKWSELANQTSKKLKIPIVLVGGPDIFEMNEEIIKKIKDKRKAHNAAGKTTVRELFELIRRAELVISIDSGPMHVGAAQGTPTIGLFSPNTPLRFGPLGKKCSYVYKPVTENPVINVHKGELPESEEDYLRKISVKDVMEQVQKIIK